MKRTHVELISRLGPSEAFTSDTKFKRVSQSRKIMFSCNIFKNKILMQDS